MLHGGRCRQQIRGSVSLAILSFTFALLGAGGCAGTKITLGPNGAGGGGGSGSGGSGSMSVDGGQDRASAQDRQPTIPDAAACTTPVQCIQPTGQYCGTIGDGCSGVIDCGACPTGQVCQKGLCVGGPGCVPSTCPTGAGAFCGMIGDGCGAALDCGACGSATQVCSSGLCVEPGCVPMTCNTTNAQYCGEIGDGCGGTLDCGACAGTATCGGGGIPNVCGGGTGCTPITCMPTGGGQYCGAIGDGCGGALNCPACPGGMACGSGGEPGVCPGATTGGCTGIQCNIQACAGTTPTTMSGTVYDPAGKTPLYNALVYIPNAPLDALPEGVSCDQCSVTLSGAPITTALTDTMGHFSLTNVPSGTNIPLVIQVGKWRRQSTIATVTPCVDNPITNVDLTRLPRTQSEGHMPKIALTTGKADALECFIRKTGIADSEFTTDTGTGRVNLFVGGEPMAGGGGQGTDSFAAAPTAGGGTMFNYAANLWADPTKLLTYDILMMSCEGGQYADVKAPYTANIKRYADAGGRLFNGHLHFYWLRNGPAPWPSTADYVGPNSDLASPIGGTINTAFPKGAALADWLVNVGASTTSGQITLYGAQYSVGAVTAPTQSWMTVNQTTLTTEYLTFNTPVEAAATAQCGRVVETDIHVKAVPSNQNGKDTSDPAKPFPSACQSTTMSAQEKALEFLFFDLSACVQPDTVKPTPPVVPPPGVPISPPGPVSTPPSVPPPPPPPVPPVVP